ncbi:MAG: hypothetical protein CL946_08720 [Ectothiorhodospiraceae bacterium]|nr:hypothetical protein [Ectothiorhodospiraceae bacterium]
MRSRKKRLTLDDIGLTNPQRNAVSKLLVAQKNKYKKLLHETHEKLHIISDHVASFEFWYNLRGHYEYVSPACERVAGYQRADFEKGGIRLEHIIHPDFLEQFHKDRAQAFSGGSGREVEYKFKRKDGEERWGLISWRPVSTRSGKLIGVRGSIVDITEFKSLRRVAHKAQIDPDQENNLIGVFSVDEEGTIISWSKPASELLGFDRSEVLGRCVVDLHEDYEEFELLSPHLSAATTLGNTMYFAELATKSGDSFPANINLTKLSNGDDHYFFNVSFHAIPDTSSS